MPMESSQTVLRNPQKCGPSTLAVSDRQVNLNQFQISRIATLQSLKFDIAHRHKIESLKIFRRLRILDFPKIGCVTPVYVFWL